MAETEQAADVERQAIERTERFAATLVDGDGDTLEGLLAPGFNYTHRSGRVETLEEILGAVRGGRRYGRMDPTGQGLAGGRTGCRRQPFRGESGTGNHQSCRPRT